MTTSTPTADLYAELAVVVRNGFTESRHFGTLAGLAADGSVAFEIGPAQQPILPRSTVKPVQAAVCQQLGANLDGKYLALAAASHDGEDEHVQAVAEMLQRCGLGADSLRCPPDLPGHAETRNRMITAGQGAHRLRMNCSGKHAAMLAACVAQGWDTDTYLATDHPLQQRIAGELSTRAGEQLAATAVDGCGAPLFGISTTGLARAIRSLVVEDPSSPGRQVADAMRQHPFYVAGTGHVNTRVMQALPGVLCKGGAEGVIVAVAANGAAVAAKVIDGSARATTVIALAGLAGLGIDTGAAADMTTVPVLGRGEPVGEIRPSDALRAALGV